MNLLASLTTTIDEQAQAQQIASAALSTLWSDVFKRGLFGEITFAFSALAVFCLAFYLVQLLANSADEGFEFNPAKLIYPFILTILLSQRGAMAMYLYVGSVQISNNIVSRMTSRISSDLNIVALSRAAQENAEVAAKVKALFDECRLISGENDIALKEQCVTAKKAIVTDLLNSGQITDTATANRLRSVLGLSPKDIDQGKNPFDLGAAANDAFQAALRIVLFGLSVAMYYGIELSMIVVGLALPPALAFGMLGRSAVIVWFSAFWSLVNLKIAYAIVMAMVSYLAVSITNANSGAAAQAFVIETLSGIFAPIIAGLYAGANGIGIFNGLSSLAIGAGSSLARGVGAGLAGAFGKAPGGASQAAPQQASTPTRRRPPIDMVRGNPRDRAGK